MSSLAAGLLFCPDRTSPSSSTLIFCGTRKSAEQAADIIAKAYRTDDDNGSAPWPRPARCV